MSEARPESSPAREPWRLLRGGAAESSDSRRRWFEFTGMRRDGERFAGRELALSVHDLDEALDERGIVLLGARESEVRSQVRSRRLTRPDLIAFSNQLAVMLGAGIPILQALAELARRTRSAPLRAQLQAIEDDLQAGYSLSEALDRRGHAFPLTLRATVRAGERSAELPEVLERQAAYLQWVSDIRATTKQALVYPAILSVAVVGLITILVTFLLPRLVKLYPGGVADLPRETRLLLGLSDFLVGNAPLLVATGVALGAGFALAGRLPGPRLFGSALLLRVPRLGELLRMIATVRFAHTAGTLHSAGCEVVQTLRLAGETCGSAFFARAFARVTERVRSGSTIADSLEREPGIDPFLVQLVAVGETSGDLSGSLAHLTRTYDQEVPRTVKWALSLIEPAVLVVGGLVVLGVVLATLLPIVTLYETL